MLSYLWCLSHIHMEIGKSLNSLVCVSIIAGFFLYIYKNAVQISLEMLASQNRHKGGLKNAHFR